MTPQERILGETNEQIKKRYKFSKFCITMNKKVG